MQTRRKPTKYSEFKPDDEIFFIAHKSSANYKTIHREDLIKLIPKELLYVEELINRFGSTINTQDTIDNFFNAVAKLNYLFYLAIENGLAAKKSLQDMRVCADIKAAQGGIVDEYY